MEIWIGVGGLLLVVIAIALFSGGNGEGGN